MAQSKQDRNRKLSGGALVGVGGTATGVGLLGGGIPGVRSNSKTIDNMPRKNPKTGAANSWSTRTGASASTMRGGIFGYRTDAHRSFHNEAKNNERYFADKPGTRPQHYLRGEDAGKIPAEAKIIRHMKVGRAASNVALVGGAAALAGGLRLNKDKKQKVHKADRAHHRSDSTNAALVTGGVSTAGVSYGGARMLEHQGRQWSKQAEHSLGEAQKIVPKLGGSETNRFPDKVPNQRVPDVGPAAGAPGKKRLANDYKFKGKRQVLAGKSKAQAEMAGRFHGDAKQARYFAGVYGKTANMARKVPRTALGVAGVGAVGLGATRGVAALKDKHHQQLKDKLHKSYNPRMSAFGVEH